MSLGQAVIGGARDLLFTQRAEAVLRSFRYDRTLSRVPCMLEPKPYCERFHAPIPCDDKIQRPVHMTVWCAPGENHTLEVTELMLRVLGSAERRARLSFTKGGENIAISLTCEAADESVVSVAPKALCGRVEVTPELPPPTGRVLRLWDYYPEAHCCDTITPLTAFPKPPLAVLFAAMMRCPADLQVRLMVDVVRVRHDWRAAIAAAADAVYLINHMRAADPLAIGGRQLPSNEVHRQAAVLASKTDPSTPLMAAAIRLAIIGDRIETPHSFGIEAFMATIQAGGRPFGVLREPAYHDAGIDLSGIVQDCRTHRPGFIANTKELAALVQLPPHETIEALDLPFRRLEGHKPKVLALSGALIGQSVFAGTITPTFLSFEQLLLHAQLIASSGHGKSSIIRAIGGSLVRAGIGICFIDPHGREVRAFADTLSPDQRKNVVIFRPGEDDWIALFNVLALARGPYRYRIIDNLVAAILGVAVGVGDRLTMLLRNGLIALSFLERAALASLLVLLRKKSPEAEALKEEIRRACPDSVVKNFFLYDFDTYSAADVAALRHKIMKVVYGGTLATMFSQTENAFSFRQIMDEGKILLVDLSLLGDESRPAIGSILLSLLLNAAMSRGDASTSTLRQFQILADEGHQFTSGQAMEGLIQNARKQKVGFLLANHYLKQCSAEQISALGTMGSTIVGHVDPTDAAQLAKRFPGNVTAEDLVALPQYHFIARLGTEVVRFRTMEPQATKYPNAWDEILAESHAKFYRSREDVEAGLPRYRSTARPSISGDMSYDELK